MTTMIETNELCSALSVSRSWVNTHLRHLGKKIPSMDPFRPSVVWYNPDDILAWIQSNATFSRQTIRIDLLDYGADEDIYRELLEDLEKPGSLAVQQQREERYDNYLKSILPPDIYNRTHISSRRRGNVPWVHTTVDLKSIGDLETIRYIMAGTGFRNEEMAYRTIFRYAMIRVSVGGRTWFVKSDLRSQKIPLTIRAAS